LLIIEKIWVFFVFLGILGIFGYFWFLGIFGYFLLFLIKYFIKKFKIEGGAGGTGKPG